MTETRTHRCTLVLVDDQRDFLDLARGRLTHGASLEVVGEATSGEAALALLAHLAPAPEGVLVDIEMPGLDGFETARRLRALVPAVHIILTSASANERYSVVARGLGVGFLPKRHLSPEAIVRLLDCQG